MSASELALWHELRRSRLGFRFRRQVRVGPYFLDFYCAEAKLCIEVDGEQHQLRRAQDAARDAFLSRQGIETLRIPSLDLFEENGVTFDKWVATIAARCAESAIRFDQQRAPAADQPISTPQPPSSLTNQSEEWGSETHA